MPPNLTRERTMADILNHPANMSDADLLDLLGPLDTDTGPDSLHLAPGETLADRIPHKLAKGRARAAEKRRKAFRAV